MTRWPAFTVRRSRTRVWRRFPSTFTPGCSRVPSKKAHARRRKSTENALRALGSLLVVSWRFEMSADFKIELGVEVRSRTTGLVGVITSRSECLYGCNRYYIQPKVDKDGKVPDGWWKDEMDLEVIGEGVKRVPANTGGPMSRDC